MIHEDDNFRHFAGTLERAIAVYQRETPNEGELLQKQCEQFQRLVGMEREFREALIRNRYGAQVYRAFMEKICEDGILTSRPYFRERQDVCLGPICRALSNRHIQSLYQYHFNYNFVAFAVRHRSWPRGGRLNVLARKIAALRHEILVLNMPLAISQARIFWSKAPAKTQDTRFTFLDFVQVAADGMMSAIDKFCLPAGLDETPALIRVWRAVAIGRMKGNFIETFSETTIHFFPDDKRKLYRANKHLKSFDGPIDFEKLATLVNTDLGADGKKTTAEELASLMGAASQTVQGGNQDEDEDVNDSPLDRAAAGTDWQPDVRFEEAETLHVLRKSVKTLSVLEQKLIRMKGVSPESI